VPISGGVRRYSAARCLPGRFAWHDVNVRSKDAG
jgi:hypothetical protein